jgi:hypothetical protein
LDLDGLGQWSSSHVFNLDVLYSHAIDTSMTIHTKGRTKHPK